MIFLNHTDFTFWKYNFQKAQIWYCEQIQFERVENIFFSAPFGWNYKEVKAGSKCIREIDTVQWLQGEKCLGEISSFGIKLVNVYMGQEDCNLQLKITRILRAQFNFIATGLE